MKDSKIKISSFIIILYQYPKDAPQRKFIRNKLGILLHFLIMSFPY